MFVSKNVNNVYFLSKIAFNILNFSISSRKQRQPAVRGRPRAPRRKPPSNARVFNLKTGRAALQRRSSRQDNSRNLPKWSRGQIRISRKTKCNVSFGV